MTTPDSSPREGPSLTPRRLLPGISLPPPNVKAGPRRRRSACGRHGAVCCTPLPAPAPGHVFPMLGRDVAGQADTQLAMAPAV